MAGRKPRPTKLKLMLGEPNKDRINDKEPEPTAGRPQMPDNLDGLAEAAWVSLVDSLEDMGLLTVADSHLLELYAHTYSGYREAVSKQKEYGQVLLQDGTAKRNPFMFEVHSHRNELLKILIEFGLTPSSRSRIVIPGKQTNDILDELLA